MKYRITIWALSAAAGLALPLGAQGFAPKRDDGVTKEQRPPQGMCRIWIDGVPATHQPAPTDCPTAIRNRPQNARVIFGDDARQKSPARLDRGTETRMPRTDSARVREPATVVTPVPLPRPDDRTRRPPDRSASDDPHTASPRFTPTTTAPPPRVEPRPAPPPPPPPRADPQPSRRPDVPDVSKRPVPHGG